MNAIAHDISAAANISAAMARDLLGYGTLRPSTSGKSETRPIKA